MRTLLNALRAFFGEAGIWLDQVEAALTDLVARTAPWLTPLPVAYLSATSTTRHFGWPWEVGLLVGIIVETVGLAAINTSLDFWLHNQAISGKPTYTKWHAPTIIPMLAALAYFATTIVLVVVLELYPVAADFAKILLVLLSAVGMTTIAMRRSHRNRIDAMIVHAKHGAYPYSGARYTARRAALLAAGYAASEPAAQSSSSPAPAASAASTTSTAAAPAEQVAVCWCGAESPPGRDAVKWSAAHVGRVHRLEALYGDGHQPLAQSPGEAIGRLEAAYGARYTATADNGTLQPPRHREVLSWLQKERERTTTNKEVLR